MDHVLHQGQSRMLLLIFRNKVLVPGLRILNWVRAQLAPCQEHPNHITKIRCHGCHHSPAPFFSAFLGLIFRPMLTNESGNSSLMIRCGSRLPMYITKIGTGI